MMTYMQCGKLMDLTDCLSDDFGITQKDLALAVSSYLEENRAFQDGRTCATSLGNPPKPCSITKHFTMSMA